MPCISNLLAAKNRMRYRSVRLRWLLMISLPALIFRSVSLSGCLSTIEEKAGVTSPVPSGRVTTAPLDTSSTYFVTDQDHDLPTARRMALQDIVAKLKVSAAGALENKTAIRNDSVSQSAISCVTEEVQKAEAKELQKLAVSPQQGGCLCESRSERV
jgi:hypothetical protein